MKELTVFYCPHCGYYGYYLIPRRAVCPSCRIHFYPSCFPETAFTIIHLSRRE